MAKITSCKTSSRSSRARESRIELGQAVAEAETRDVVSSSSSSDPIDDEPIKKRSSVAFELNKAPMLEGVDRQDLVKFLEDYKAYVEVFEEPGADGVEP